MSLAIAHRTLRTVRLIDDEASVRASYRYSVEDLELNAEEVVGPISDSDDFVNMFDPQSDAAICDLNLRSRRYSSLNGDQLVSSLYKVHIPAVLCTKWAGRLPEDVRFRRRQIPVVLSPNDLTSDSIRQAFEVCSNEFAGQFAVSRRPWRTMIRIESGEPIGFNHFRLSLVIPAWSQSIGITFDAPAGDPIIHAIRAQLEQGEIIRVFGQVNLGAESEEDIYVDAWSLT